MRGIMAIVLACLLSFTAPLTTSVSAADLGMPLKAPPPVEAPAAVEFNYVPLVAAVIVGGVIACAVLCFQHHHHAVPPVSPGANTDDQLAFSGG